MRFRNIPSSNNPPGCDGQRVILRSSRWFRFAVRSKLIWIPLVVAGLVISADFLAAAQQRRLLKVTVTRHVMAALQQDADKPIDQSLRAHWITADAEGNIEGRISALDSETADALPIKQLTVTLLKKGQRVSKAKTDVEGRFLLKDVDAGVYTLVAWGKTGFLAYGVHVLPRLEELDLDEEDELNVRKTDRTPLNVQQRQAWYVSHFNLPIGAVVAEELQIDAAAVPPEFTTLRKISQNYMSASSAFSILADKGDLKAIAKADLTSGGFQFPLSANGHFHGRLQPIATEDGKPTRLSDMNLFLIQEDVEILRVAAEENGDFRMDDVEPGVYSLVAAGEDGFAALSLELVAAEGAGGNADDEDQGDARSNSGSGIIHRVSTVAANPAVVQDGEPKVNIPSLGIAIVTDKNDLKQISTVIDTISDINLAGNGPPAGGFNGGNVGGLASSGFAPSGFASGGFAPGGFASGPIVTSSFPAGGGFAPSSAGPVALSPGLGVAGLPRLFGAGGGRILGLAGLAGGITAIADDSSSAPLAATASTTGS